MGDPKFSRRRYQTPSHPWQKERIEQENELIKKYGLKNKKELWKAQSLLRNFRQRSRILQAQIRYGNKQAELERDQLLGRLERAGILGGEETLDDVLGLDVEAVLSRRLQTLAYLKGLSNSTNQARQFIVHGHVSIGDRKITIPGYLVKKTEEESIDYLPSSPIANDMHPARPKDELELAEEKKRQEEAARAEAAAAAEGAKPEGDAPAPDAKPEGTPEAPKVEEAPAKEAPKAEDKPKAEVKKDAPAPEPAKEEPKKEAPKAEEVKKETPAPEPAKEEPKKETPKVEEKPADAPKPKEAPAKPTEDKPKAEKKPAEAPKPKAEDKPKEVKE